VALTEYGKRDAEVRGRLQKLTELYALVKRERGYKVCNRKDKWKFMRLRGG